MKASLTNWKVTAQFVYNYYITLSQATSAGYEKNPDDADIYKVEEVMQVFTIWAMESVGSYSDDKLTIILETN